MKKILIFRDEKFVIKDGITYIVGSSSNELFKNNAYQMGSITLFGWKEEHSKYNKSSLSKLAEDENIEIILCRRNEKLHNKIIAIRNAVKKAEYLSIKLFFFDSIIACHYANKYKKPYVIESGVDVFVSLWKHGGMKYKLAALPCFIISQYYHKKSKYIIYVSKHYLQKKYTSKAFQIGCSDAVLPNFETSVLTKRISRIGLKHRYKLGLIGSSTASYRGHDTAILILSNLINKGYDVELSFLGNDSKSEKYLALSREKGIQERVFFDGYKEKQGVYEWIDNIDILVMPTQAETLGRAVIEAMARGCPVIGTIETALSEQIGSDCIFSYKDAAGMTKHIMNLLDNDDYMKLCCYENFYRGKKYCSEITNEWRKDFYDNFYRNNEVTNG